MRTQPNSCQKPIINTDSCNQKTVTEFYSSSKQKIIPQRIKSSITTACAEFAALDGRAFETMSGKGFLNLAQQLFDAGRVLGNSSTIKIEDLIPHSTTPGYRDP
ncbi:unnamed protein product [Rotaria sordida]|uniref:Hermes trasposase DNA-binding domain-containing protein n=1 Tax=Rotaria sordida TaxID=392033 RepID=A0A819URE4_9BILA|nr:unnamed protein product [Rotaria sordida]CAF4096718.1 unnamed protein product [Rotaria sordida]